MNREQLIAAIRALAEQAKTDQNDPHILLTVDILSLTLELLEEGGIGHLHNYLTPYRNDREDTKSFWAGINWGKP